MGKEMKMTKVRDAILDGIVKHLRATYEAGVDPKDTAILPIESGVYMMPITDEDGNEAYCTIQVKIPRGQRQEGTYKPFDGFAAAQAYQEELEAKALEAQIKEENKRQKEAEKERKKKLRTKKIKVDDLEKMKKEIREVIAKEA